ncbi:FMN-dependent dehydrogenase-domain-containing protein [Thelephora terrestris]|uniref:L-lactate dehydrogenase (cytochrome) n=1 Tax=Thelephora terrestris TaxID=56493 RepID=A0A9P6HH83_9AGAM|nr:FMN-dependent dehydrogenase-domain-containing protein [Thelephora terrestris]
MAKAWSLNEIAKHNAASDCWVIIDNKVYDVTEFLSLHPGGEQIILKYAGRDATAAYKPIHPEDALEKSLPKEKHLGFVDANAIRELQQSDTNRKQTKDELRMERAKASKLPLGRILTLQDMEDVARDVLSYKANAYYSSAADDQITHTENVRAFSRFFFHPRVLRTVSQCSPATKILGCRSSLPIFVSSAALAKLGHPLGETNITRGAGRTGVIQMVSTNASFSASEIYAARVSPTQPLFFQLYKKRDDSEAEKLVQEVEALGYNAIFLTVDAIVAGRRDRDIKAPFALEDQEREGTKQQPYVEGPQEEEGHTLGTSGALVAGNDVDMTWEKTIPWLRSVTKLPIVIKGIQCVADAVLAAETGVDGILISNHGGRQLEYSLPSIEVLYRLRIQRPDIFQRIEVYVEGGARRGTDILKALCLGATAVGMGRPFLYAQSAYGDAGVVKIIRILEQEIVYGMRLLGASSVRDLVPEMVERVDWQPELPVLAKL